MKRIVETLGSDLETFFPENFFLVSQDEFNTTTPDIHDHYRFLSYPDSLPDAIIDVFSFKIAFYNGGFNTGFHPEDIQKGMTIGGIPDRTGCDGSGFFYMEGIDQFPDFPDSLNAPLPGSIGNDPFVDPAFPKLDRKFFPFDNPEIILTNHCYQQVKGICSEIQYCNMTILHQLENLPKILQIIKRLTVIFVSEA
jgi:hypothetical protein